MSKWAREKERFSLASCARFSPFPSTSRRHLPRRLSEDSRPSSLAKIHGKLWQNYNKQPHSHGLFAGLGAGWKKGAFSRPAPPSPQARGKALGARFYNKDKVPLGTVSNDRSNAVGANTVQTTFLPGKTLYRQTSWKNCSLFQREFSCTDFSL